MLTDGTLTIARIYGLMVMVSVPVRTLLRSEPGTLISVDKQLAAVRARLDAIAAIRDLSGVLDEDVTAEARALAEALAGAESGDQRVTVGRYVLGWLHWYRSVVAAGEVSAHESDAAAVNFLPLFADPFRSPPLLPDPLPPQLLYRTMLIAAAEDVPVDARIALVRRVLDATGDQQPEYPGRLAYLSMLLHQRSAAAPGRAGLADLEQAIQVARAAIDATPADDAQRPMYRSSLVSMLTSLSDQAGRPELLDEAVQAGRLAAAEVRDDDPVRGAILALFETALFKQAARSGSIAVLDELVSVSRAALRSASGDRGSHWSLLGAALQARFEQAGVLADLDEAVAAHRDAVACIPPGDARRPEALANLSMCLRVRFGRTAVVADVSEAVERGRGAAGVVADDAADRGTCLMSLGLALLARFDRFGAIPDLTEAVDFSRAAAAIDDEPATVRATRLSNLSLALQTLDERTDTPGAAAQAVAAGRGALALTEAVEISRPGRESNLSIALANLFRRTGAINALDEAVDLAGRAVEGVPPGHPDRPLFLSNASRVRLLRFTHAGVTADLDAAIRLGRESVRTAPPGLPDRAIYLSNLGATLHVRAERTGSTDDLEAAIGVQEEAMDRTPGDHPDRARRLANLAVAMKVRAARTGSGTDLDDAVSAARAAAAAMHPDHADRAAALTNLGSALRERFKRGGSPDDITDSIQAHRQALAAVSEDRPDRSLYLTNYANALQARGVSTGSADDLRAAISTLRRASAAPSDHDRPRDDPYRAIYLYDLGNALRASGELTGSEPDRRAAVESYAAAVEDEAAPPSVRVAAAALMAEILTSPDPARHAGVLAAAVRLLPRLAGWYLTRGDRQTALSGLSGLIADAAALTLMDERLPHTRRAERALGLIEVGRNVISTQLLNIRSDISELARKDAGLARRFLELRDMLDPASTIAATVRTPDGDAHVDLYELSQEFDALLARIRELPGLASFAALPSGQELRRDASQGPVVTFNISRHRDDALLLTTAGVRVVPLPGLRVGAVGERLGLFFQALADAARPDYAARVQAQSRLAEVLGWLWDTAAGPVLDALAYTQRPASGIWPRVWWAPGGLLGLLPVHAAGYHDGSGLAVLDRVISSYTPTIRALRYAREKAASAAAVDRSAPGPARSLIIAMPTTPAAAGHPVPEPLRYAAAEASTVAAHMAGALVLASPDHDDPVAPIRVTRDAVFAGLPDCAIAHFACHGDTDPVDPSLSRLLLQDHATAPLTVASLPAVRLDRARLAYLSACHTAHQQGTALLDEGIHLASAFQLTGFPHVIAALWQLGDSVAVEVADAFYASLTSGQTLDPDRAAAGLHHAVNTIRASSQYGPVVSAWAPYIHVGA
jgi:tetratricopeptide (TPR) repeat protein